MNTTSIREVLKDFDEGKFKLINENQKDAIRKKYGIYTNFKYYLGKNLYIYVNKETFSRLEYYLGLEYEREHIKIKIEDGEILIGYDIYAERISLLEDLLRDNE